MDRGLASDHEWLADQLDAVIDTLDVLRPSEWAEQTRYLPPSVTALPGYYSFDVAPYVREILDCLSVDSPIREVAWMKGAQICATVGVLENGVGYYMDHVGTAPMMLLTADAELAKLRLTSYITPMIQHSGLSHLIASSDEKNTRKTGKTDSKVEWIGGGFLIPFGAQNANKLRSVSIQVLFRDEIDGYPDVVGKDGDPLKLSEARTAAYEASRKILDLSTPLIKGRSKIEQRFNRGDKRRYFVRCLSCNFEQTLKFRRQNHETGEVSGITWETENGRIVPDSVRYRCRECGHPHTNEDKTRLLSPDHGARWIPTKVADAPHIRSYHLSALYSPVGMQSWAACAESWLDAWDTEHNRPRDNAALQVFYNNILGEPFVKTGDRVQFRHVSQHRRDYNFGQVPNKLAENVCGSPILLLTCSVDVHKDNLAVGVFGWCRDRRVWLVDYWRFEGDTERLDNPDTWGRLRELIEDHEYVADDGKRYRIQLTLVDSGYRADDVYRFAADYGGGVYPVKGREAPKTAQIKHFTEFSTPMGVLGFGITVDWYKERVSVQLRRGWDGQSIQPQGHFNAPDPITDKQLKELTAEVKSEKRDKATDKFIGWEWHRTAHADNELWDCLIYANAALDMIAWDVCIRQMGLAQMNWVAFWDICTEPVDPEKPGQKPFYRDG